MDQKHYRKSEFDNLRNRLNKEILRRRAWNWWDPLQRPEIGQDKTPHMSLPNNSPNRKPVTEYSYTINNPSSGAITETRNISKPAYGVNPVNDDHTSSTNFDYDEARNFLNGLSKMHDIDLFYGVDELNQIAFRNSQDIETKLIDAEDDIKTRATIANGTKYDPNLGKTNANNYGNPGTSSYPMSLPGGETDGDQSPVSNQNYYDDYNGGPPYDANYTPTKNSLPNPTPSTYSTFLSWDPQRDGSSSPGKPNYNHVPMVNQPGNHQYRPYNPQPVPVPSPATTGPNLDNRGNFSFYPNPNPDQIGYGKDHNIIDPLPRPIPLQTSGSRFGTNPRNPNPGNDFRPRKSHEGVPGLCHVACTGLCYLTCYDACTESCDRVCWNRCGNACYSTCGNVCTGCNTLCYSSCLTKCQASTGYACQYNGSVSTTPTPSSGNTLQNPYNSAIYNYRTCNGTCQWTCEYYPNYKTQCWDTACMTICVTTCNQTCLNSCFGGCINNPNNAGRSFFSRNPNSGCQYNCTHDCSGDCYQAACAGDCTSCTAQCAEDCSASCAESRCYTNCQSSCNRTECKSSCDHDCGSDGDSDAEEEEEPEDP